jgi:proton-dependent oligopeptide transporter, POT family
MGMKESIERVRGGFHPSFWVANGMELFERLAYYGQATVFSIYLRNHLHFNELDAGTISSIFGGLLWLFPIVAGTLADKYGFRRAFSFAFLILMVGYFLIGSTGMEVFSGFYAGKSLFWMLVPMVILTAIGGSFIKPSVLGTVAVTSKPETKSLGYAFYYWLVNIGAMLGPVIANFVRRGIGIEFVYMVSAVSCGLMFIANLLFYREVEGSTGAVVESLGTKMKNLVQVLANFRFIIFLLIFSLYWIMFWAGLYIVMPFYITDAIAKDANYEFIVAVGAAAIIVFQLIVNRLTKDIPTRTAILIGFGVSSCAWLIVAAAPSLWIIAVGVAVWSLGEMTQAPRYYEYISDLAPKGQQALFQGYAFLPIAIAWMVGGRFGGWLYVTYSKDSANPGTVWYVLFGVGVLATALMFVYNAMMARQEKVRPA